MFAACIQEFLSTTPPDRKFYLPQTVEVLRGSVQKLIHFAAYEASIAFDAIAQYANNLLTKPWRAEYKVIKVRVCISKIDFRFISILRPPLIITDTFGFLSAQNQISARRCG